MTRSSKQQWRQLEELFGEAFEIEPDRRGEWLAALDVDEALRTELELMLAVDERDDALRGLRRDRDRLLAETQEAQPDALEGQRFGAYRVLHCIGEGGMGRVYRARRVDGVADVDVAIKVLHPRSTAVSAHQRFQLERAVLARLDHPNIASMLDGGVTPEGLAYLVMQFVEGEPLLDWCDQRRCSLRRRIELMVDVCRAVEFAHNHLVVHRDLKSSNILVTEDGRVKLLDFGIAKLLDPDALDPQSLAFELHQTRTETRVATPLNAAPEQLLGGDITTATDVYGLGVLLFELLCGRLPYDLESAKRSDVERAVVEQPVLRPRLALRRTSVSQPLSTAEISQRRDATEADLVRQLQGDLEVIVLMALRKEPERRYASAGQLGEDLQRYLEGLPVRARADNPSYRLRKFVGRNRLLVSSSVLLVVAMLVVTITTALQARRLARERDRSELFAQTMVSVLENGMPANALSDSIPVSDLMAPVEEAIADLEDRPLDQARLLHVLGRLHQSRGRPLEAAEVFQQELDAWVRAGKLDDPAVADLRWQLAQASDEAGLHERAPQLYREAIASLEQLSETDHRLPRARKNLTRYMPPPAALQELSMLLDEAQAAGKLDNRRNANNLARLQFEMGRLLAKLGRREAAEEQFARSLDLINRHHHPLARAPLTMRAELAAVRHGDPQAEIGELREIVAQRSETAGAETAFVAEALRILAQKLVEYGRWHEADEEVARAEVLMRATLSPTSEQFAQIALVRAAIASGLGDPERELEELQRAEELVVDEIDRATVRARLAVAWARRDPALSLQLAEKAAHGLSAGWDPRVGSDWRLARGWLDLAKAASIRDDDRVEQALQALASFESWERPPDWFGPGLETARASVQERDL